MRAHPRRSRKQAGEGTTEYALLIVLIGLLVVGAIRLLGSATSSQMKKTGDVVSGSSASGGGAAGSGGSSGSGTAGGSSSGGSGGAGGSTGSAGSAGSGSGGSGSGGGAGSVGNAPAAVH